jgi:hypothetical protein
VLGPASVIVPILLVIVGTASVVGGPVIWLLGMMDLWNAIMLPIGGICLLLVAGIAHQVHGGLRDRVLAILVLGIFVIFFWGAFEQAGNVQNLWADQSTNRFLTQPMDEPRLFTPVKEAGKKDSEPHRGMSLANFFNQFQLKHRLEAEESWSAWFLKNLNPVPTGWFQSINACAIFVLAPLFAWLWISLDRRGYKLSIPVKMVIGLVMMSLSMVVMAGAANQENQLTSVPWILPNFPSEVKTNALHQLGRTNQEGTFEPFHAGRLVYDSEQASLNLMGVLTNSEAFRIIGTTAPKEFNQQIQVLQAASGWIGTSRSEANKQREDLKKKWQEKLTKAKPDERKQLEADNEWLVKLVFGSEDKEDAERITSVGLALQEIPNGFDMRYSELPKSAVEFVPGGKILVVRKDMTEKEVKGLKVAAGDPKFRDTVESLFKSSSQWKVSPWWLFWSYILATIGELVISPVGLSMVSKLSPTRFATMLMGVWLFTNAFGNFAAGYLGELWGTIPPTTFFLYVAGGVLAAACVLLALVHWVVRTMHGVR